MQQCLAQILTAQPLPARRIIAHDVQRDGNDYTVTLHVETPQGRDRMGIPLSHGADGWRVALSATDLGCNPDASGFPDPASAASAYLQTLNGYDYGTPRIAKPCITATIKAPPKSSSAARDTPLSPTR